VGTTDPEEVRGFYEDTVELRRFADARVAIVRAPQLDNGR
jgi:hypothetical protein